MTVLADFRCPVHGVFEQHADPDVDAVACPRIRDVRPDVTADEAYRKLRRGDFSGTARCGLASPWSPSPLRIKVAISATRGGIERPEHRDWDFTANLEEGQDADEWQADRNAAAERRREDLVVDMVRSDR